jgi:hypothetical protein
LLGDEGITAEGGGELPRIDCRREGEAARIVVVVGIEGEFGTLRLGVVVGCNVEPEAALLGPFPFSPSEDTAGRIVEPLPPAEPILETELFLAPLRVEARAGVLNLSLAPPPPPPPPTSMGGVLGDVSPSVLAEVVLAEMVETGREEMWVVCKESARSFADNSFERVRPIFLDVEGD